MVRKRALRRTRDSDGLAFDRWVREQVMVRDEGRCQAPGCRRAGTDCAHAYRLGAGASRFKPADWRNWPQVRVLLCRQCHRAADELREWTIGDLLEPAAIVRAKLDAAAAAQGEATPWVTT